MNKTYFQVIDKLEEIGERAMNEVFTGDVWEVEASERKYPLMVIDPHLKTHTYRNGVYNLRIDVYCVDLVYDDESNERYVLSDMTSNLIDYINILRDNESEFGFIINKDQGEVINFQSFTEKWDDKVSGVRAELNVLIPDGGDTCENIFNV